MAAPSASQSSTVRIVLTQSKGTSRSMLTTLRFDNHTTTLDLLGLLAQQENLSPEEASGYVVRTPDYVLPPEALLTSLYLETIPYIEHLPKFQRIKVSGPEGASNPKLMSLDATVPVGQILSLLLPEFHVKDEQASLVLLTVVCPHPAAIFADLTDTELAFMNYAGIAIPSNPSISSDGAHPNTSSSPSTVPNITPNAIGASVQPSISSANLAPAGGFVELDPSLNLFQQGVRTGAHLQLRKKKKGGKDLMKWLGKRKSFAFRSNTSPDLTHSNPTNNHSVASLAPSIVCKTSRCNPAGLLKLISFLDSFCMHVPALFVQTYSASFLLSYKVLIDSIQGNLNELDHYDNGKPIANLLLNSFEAMDPRLLEPLQSDLVHVQTSQKLSKLPTLLNWLSQDERNILTAWAHMCNELIKYESHNYYNSKALAKVFLPVLTREKRRPFTLSSSNSNLVRPTAQDNDIDTIANASNSSNTSSFASLSSASSMSINSDTSSVSSSATESLSSTIQYMIENPTVLGDCPIRKTKEKDKEKDKDKDKDKDKSSSKEKSSKKDKKVKNSASGPGTLSPSQSSNALHYIFPSDLKSGTASPTKRDSREDDAPASPRSTQSDSNSSNEGNGGSAEKLIHSSPDSAIGAIDADRARYGMLSNPELIDTPSSPIVLAADPTQFNKNADAEQVSSSPESVGGSRPGSGAFPETSAIVNSFMLADFPWTPSVEGDIELRKGDLLQIFVADPQGWYVGKLLNVPGNPVGVFPSTYCSPISKSAVESMLKLDISSTLLEPEEISSEDSSSSFSASSLYHHLVSARVHGYSSKRSSENYVDGVSQLPAKSASTSARRTFTRETEDDVVKNSNLTAFAGQNVGNNASKLSAPFEPKLVLPPIISAVAAESLPSNSSSPTSNLSESDGNPPLSASSQPGIVSSPPVVEQLMDGGNKSAPPKLPPKPQNLNFRSAKTGKAPVKKPIGNTQKQITPTAVSKLPPMELPLLTAYDSDDPDAITPSRRRNSSQRTPASPISSSGPVKSKSGRSSLPEPMTSASLDPLRSSHPSTDATKALNHIRHTKSAKRLSGPRPISPRELAPLSSRYSPSSSNRASPRDTNRLSLAEDQLEQSRDLIHRLQTTVFALEQSNKVWKDTVTEQERNLEKLSTELESLKRDHLSMPPQVPVPEEKHTPPSPASPPAQQQHAPSHGGMPIMIQFSILIFALSCLIWVVQNTVFM